MTKINKVLGEGDKRICKTSKVMYYLIFALLLWLVNDSQAALVGQWKMNDNAATTTVINQVSPNGIFNDANGNSDTEAHSVAGQAGIPNTALRFDGVDDYINCGTDPGFQISSAITLVAWVNYKSGGQCWVISKSGGGSLDYSMYVRMDVGGKVAFAGTIAGAWVDIYGNTAVSATQWHHVAVTFDGTDIKFYLDGNPDGVTNNPGTIAARAGQLTIGLEATWLSQRMNGDAADVRVYNTALTSNAIKNIYDSEKSLFFSDIITKGPWVDVRAFGATGNGTTDDTAAIQSAIDSLTNGGVVLFPSHNTFRIHNAGIKVGNNVTLLGDQSTVLKATDTFTLGDGYIIGNKDTTNGNNNIKIIGLKIDGNSRAARCILISKVTWLGIHGILTTNPWQLGAHIDVRYTNYATISNNFMDGNSNGLGINVLDGSNHVIVSNNIGKNLHDSLVSAGSGGTLCTNISIINNELVNNTTGYGVDLFGTIETVTIQGNILKGAYIHGIRTGVAGGVNYPGDVLITGNTILSAGQQAIDIHSASTANAVVSDNYINNSSNGILVNVAKEVVVRGNLITNSGTGIKLNSDIYRAQVSGNSIYNSTSGYGIRILDGKGSVITDNRLEGGSYTGIYCEGIKDGLISNNVVKNFGQAGNAVAKHGIQLVNGAVIGASIDNIITGNRVFDDQGTKTQDTGILTQGSSDYNLITSNNCRGNKTTSISTVGANNVIANNIQ